MEIIDWKLFKEGLNYWLYESVNLHTEFYLRYHQRIESNSRLVNLSQLKQYLQLKKAIENFDYNLVLNDVYVTVELSRLRVDNISLKVSLNYLVSSHSELEEVLSYDANYPITIWTEDKSIRHSSVEYVPSGLSFSEKKNYVISNSKNAFVILLHSRIYLGEFKILNTRYPVIAPNVKFIGNNKRYLDVEYIGNYWPWQSLKKYSLIPTNSILKIDGSIIMGRKDVLERFPLNPKLEWGEGEDVWWSSYLSLNAVTIKVDNGFVYSMTSKWRKRSYILPRYFSKFIWLVKNRTV